MSPMRPPISCPRCRGSHRSGERCALAPRKVADPFYNTPGWERLRVTYRKRHSLCERCERDGKVVIGQLVHHIVPIKEAWSLRFMWDNLETLCKTCHNKEHGKVMAAGT